MSDQQNDAAPQSSEELGELLDPRHLVFAEEYLRTWSATQAAKYAKYSHPGQQGERLLKREDVTKYIQARLKETAVSADEVLSRLSQQARTNISNFIELSEEAVIDKDGNNLGSRKVVNLKWDAIMANGHLVKSITNTRNGPKLELYDAQSALIQIGKAHKLFADREVPIELNLTVTSDDMAKARAKAKQHEASLLSDG